ncbi:DUF4347 domain-containing protein, partial [Thalassobaculum fulvum]|uniref:DUF4347 domain-containing protein n=1 Tax=Thalassobaculum fulvum TaxID=1633335 RepID=UPI00167664E4
MTVIGEYAAFQTDVAEILFVDSDVAAAEVLLAGIRPGIEVVRLPVSGDPVASIAMALAGRRAVGLPELTALHILSHGAPGRLQLSGRMVDGEFLAARPELLGCIRDALADEAEIVLYGCAVAEGATGAAFVDRLSQLLGRPVAASDRVVGARALGGDWSIAAKSGLAFGEPALAAYPHRLPTFDFESVTLSGTGSLQQSVGGVTVTATRSDGGTWSTSSTGGVTGNFLDSGSVISAGNTATLTFSVPVNITAVSFWEASNPPTTGGNYVLTPTTGTTINLAENTIAAFHTDLSPTGWNGVTSFTVSYSVGSSNYFVGLDTIVFTVAAPGTPSTPDLTAGTDLGASSTDNITSSATQTFTGTSTSATQVHVLVNGVTVGTATPDGSGTWTFSTSLSAGSYAITAIGDDGTTESGS